MPNTASVANDLFKQLAASGRVSHEQIEKARAELQHRGGLPWTHLVAVGVPPADVLAALSTVSQIPAAPVDRLRKATRAMAAVVDAGTAWRLLAAPFAAENGVLEIAFADPRLLDEARAVLPPHKAYVALEAHIRTMLNGLYGQQPAPQSPPPASPAFKDKLPDAIGPYKIQRKLGEGGMADVYLGVEPGNPRPVALKVMRDHLTNDPTFVQRFAHEARATVGMRHDNIVEVLSYGDKDGRYYMACEFVDGGTVSDLLEKLGRLPAPLAAEIFAQMMAGLGFAHGKITVHRDLKPANLLLSSQGRVKVSDFGIAKTEGGAALTQTGLLIGTAAYMSPEQAQGQQVDSRSDLFTCGIILFQLLTGQNPFDSDNPTTSILRIISGSYPLLREYDPTVPSALEDVVEKLIQKDLTARYATAAEVLADLQPYLTDLRATYPNLVADALRQPLELKEKLLHGQADGLVAQSKELLAGNAGEKARAALLLYRATRLAPDHPEAATLFANVVQTESFRFGPSPNPKIQELEELLQKNADAPGPLQQLAQLYRMEGNLDRAVSYLKKYLRVRPKDIYAQTQLQQLTGEKAKVIVGAAPQARASGNVAYGAGTAGLMAGIKTGGFAADGKAAAPPKTFGAPSPSGGSQRGKPNEPAPEGVTFYEPGTEPKGFDWREPAKKAAPYIIGLLAIVVVFKVISRFIDSSTKDMGDKSLHLADQIAKDKVVTGAVGQKIRQQEEQALRETGSPEVRAARKHLESAIGAYSDGRYQDALTSAQALVQNYPGSSSREAAQMIIANAHLQLGQTGEAQAALDVYITNYRGAAHYPEAVMRRGELLVKTGQPRQAIGDFTEVVKNWGSSPYVAEALLLRGQTRAALGEKDDARSDLKLAETREPPGSPVYARIKAALQNLGE